MGHVPFIRSKWLTVVLHVLVWGLLFMLPFIRSAPSPDHRFAGGPPPVFMIVQNVFWVIFFYFNIGVLIPAFFTKQKMMLYVASLLGLFILLIFLYQLLLPMHEMHVGMVIFPFLFIVAISTTYWIIGDHFKNEKVQKERENESLKSELAFLRSQINPHFIFNVLNNMVALARKKSDALEPTLIRLSNLLHYMLYESDDDKISLEREIESIKDYVDLQRIRFGEQLMVQTHFNMGEMATRFQIEPMLLIPFVENAFKHGTEVIENPSIEITLLQEGNDLSFLVVNKFSAIKSGSMEKHTGIGLGNVKRRLELLYPNRHRLTVSRINENYVVNLQIKLE